MRISRLAFTPVIVSFLSLADPAAAEPAHQSPPMPAGPAEGRAVVPSLPTEASAASIKSGLSGIAGSGYEFCQKFYEMGGDFCVNYTYGCYLPGGKSYSKLSKFYMVRIPSQPPHFALVDEADARVFALWEAKPVKDTFHGLPTESVFDAPEDAYLSFEWNDKEFAETCRKGQDRKYLYSRLSDPLLAYKERTSFGAVRRRGCQCLTDQRTTFEVFPKQQDPLLYCTGLCIQNGGRYIKKILE